MKNSKQSAHSRAPNWQWLALATIAFFAALGSYAPAHAKGGVNFVMESVIRVDPARELVTLPVFQGLFNGSPVY